MRNPFARLAKPDTARPSLRERAASLKASASRVIRRKPVDAAPDAALAADPILAAIAETRRLQSAIARASALPQPAGSLDPLPEQTAAMAASNAHIDNVLLQTVPTTAAGCAALARYAIEFLDENDFVLDEDLNNEQHVRILGLIARSPMLDSLPKGRPLAPDLSGMSDNALIRTYNAFKAASDIAGLTTWAVLGKPGDRRLLDAEGDRLSFFQTDITDELARRGVPDNSASASRRFDALIDRAVACSDYEEAARLATLAAARP
ncbi:hypothetical protein [Methylobacterium flocculans]|uniref:hypothetical protein n=1 Tax=Methylobacterium flocculans TaxID=2984843 RepID=UPI0021F343A5|nr:hypothetical protein [Methylobacterium sp. FF17]